MSVVNSSPKENKAYPARILVVDDDQSFGLMLQSVIEQMTGYACSYAENATEALKLMEKTIVDVVITDIRMPNITGLALTRTVKEKFHAGVIVLTGYYEDFTYEEVIEQGADDFMEKSAQPAELAIRLKRLLRERESLRKRREAEDNLQRTNLDLEQRVAERTAELSRTNALIEEQIIELRTAQEKIKASLQEKEILLREIHHRVKNNMQVISGFLEMEIRSAEDSAFAGRLKEIQRKIRSMALIQEKLYNAADMSSIDWANM